MKRLVVAYDQNRGIGVNGDLPWGRDLPTDLRHFRALTLGRTVIMGRITFESVGVLPDRENMIVTHYPLDDTDAVAVSSLQIAFSRAQHEPVIIGGASIYRQALDYVDVVHATEVHADFPDTDTFFPELDDSWHEVERDEHVADERNKYNFDFVTFKRRA
jgi:dihydrofolate reductase